MDLEGIVLSEISQRKTNTVWYYSYVESEKYKKLVNIAKKKQTYRFTEQSTDYQSDEWRGKGQNGREFRNSNYYAK